MQCIFDHHGEKVGSLYLFILTRAFPEKYNSQYLTIYKQYWFIYRQKIREYIKMKRGREKPLSDKSKKRLHAGEIMLRKQVSMASGGISRYKKALRLEFGV